MSNTIITVLIVVCLILGIVAFRSCQPKAPDHTAGDKKVDSITSVLKTHDSASLKVVDSVKKIAAIAIKSKDSLTKEILTIKGSLKGKDRDIQGLVDAL